MKKIDAGEYFDLMLESFPGVDPVELEDMTVISEKILKLQWGNRLRFFSYITYTEELDAELMINYKNRCVQLAKKTRSAFAEPAVCIAVVIADEASRGAIDFARSAPAIHLMRGEYPVIADLTRGEAFYYKGPVPVRLLYNRYERKYIDFHFAGPLRALTKKTPL